jgi:hypothetical protein
MDKKMLAETLRKINALPANTNFTGQVSFVINMNQGGVVSVERSIKEIIIK